MPYCVFKSCRNSSSKQKSNSGISFHRFPLDDDLCQEWISVVRQNRKDPKWKASKYCVICSEHFRDEDIYLTGKKYRCLKKEAIPVLVHVKQEPAEIVYVPVPDADDIAKCEDMTEEPTTPTMRKQHKQSSKSEKSSKNIESDFLRKRRSRKDEMRHELLIKSRRKIKTLQQIVRRLKERNRSLKSIVKQLRIKKAEANPKVKTHDNSTQCIADSDYEY